jgi:DNA-binding MarR family transcriptional regulator
MPGVNSRHWDSIIDALAEGPIIDPSGLATQKLMAATGHESTNSLAKILRRMEEAGVIERDIAGRRTTRIALTAATLDEIQHSEPAPVQELSRAEAAQDGVDYDLLAAALLAKALKATQAQEASAGAKDAEARARKAEARVAIAEADAQAARAKAAELEATIRALEHNLKALQAALDKPAKRTGTSVREHLDAASRRELDQLMRALPTRRG